MAELIPMKSSAAFRLNAGVDQTTGKAVLKSVSIRGVDPEIAADGLEAVSDAVSPLFEYPVITVEKTITELLDVD